MSQDSEPARKMQDGDDRLAFVDGRDDLPALIPTDILRSPRLSLAAKGIFATLRMSGPITVEGLCEMAADDPKETRAGLLELMDAGLVTRRDTGEATTYESSI